MRDTHFPELATRPTDRDEVRRQLDASVVELRIDRGSGAIRFEGTSSFGPALEGPPGRLHGGLHAYARLFPLLAAIPDHGGVATFPCALELRLRRAIDLGTPIGFRGTYEAGDDFRLSVEHGEGDRLAASLRRAHVQDDPIERFRERALAIRDAEPGARMVAERDLRVDIHPELVRIDASADARRTTSTLSTYLAPDGSVDAALVCMLLDVVGAVVLGWDVQGRCYTVRMQVVVASPTIGADEDLIALADRRTRPDPSVGMRPVDLGDRLVEPTEVAVLLTDPELRRAHAWGSITMVAATRRT